MKWYVYSLLCVTSLLYGRDTVIVAFNPLRYVREAVDAGDRVFVVLPTNRVARYYRKQCGHIENVHIFAVPLFSHSKRFTLYALDPTALKVGVLPEDGARHIATRPCLSLDEFCDRANIEPGAKLVVDWGNNGYYVVRYAMMDRFGEVVVRGLSDKYDRRLLAYFEVIHEGEL